MSRRKKLSLNTILSAMRPGIHYTAQELAELASVPLTTVRHLLCSDRAVTSIDVRTRRGRRSYALAGTCGGEHHVDTRVHPDLTSVLTGYQASIDRQIALAMAARPMR